MKYCVGAVQTSLFLYARVSGLVSGFSVWTTFHSVFVNYAAVNHIKTLGQRLNINSFFSSMLFVQCCVLGSQVLGGSNMRVSGIALNADFVLVCQKKRRFLARASCIFDHCQCVTLW